MIGAALLAREEAVPTRMSGRLVVCPTPIGNLEDVTLRVLSALRDADVVACEDTRRTRVLLERYGVQASLVSYHEHNERERAAELVERMRSGAVVALVVGRRDAAGQRSRLRARAGRASRRGSRSRSCPGRPRRWPHWWRPRCRPTVALRGLPAAQAGGAGGGVRARRRRWWRSSRRAGSPRRCGCWRSSTLTRPVAVCRELTKVHEEVVRGSASELAGRYARGAAARRGRARGRRRAAEAAGPSEAAVDAVRRLVDAGAKPRPAASVVAEFTGVPANELYRAVSAAS